jgi:hypothetical protein
MRERKGEEEKGERGKEKKEHGMRKQNRYSLFC